MRDFTQDMNWCRTRERAGEVVQKNLSTSSQPWEWNLEVASAPGQETAHKGSQ